VNYSQIDSTLFVGTTPLQADYQTLRSLGVELVINMRAERRPYPDLNDPPMPVLWLPTFDTPLIPISIRTLSRGVRAALATMEKGGKVYIHCAMGMHRSVAQAASILIAMGYTLEDAVGLIKQRRAVADPHAWYIFRRIERFAQTWRQASQQLDFLDQI
jgi:protein-tyrosine phosphatase